VGGRGWWWWEGEGGLCAVGCAFFK